MRKRSYRVSPGLVVLVLLFLSGIIWYQTNSFANVFLAQIHKNMRERTELIKHIVKPYIGKDIKPVLDEFRRVAKAADVRLSLIDHTGKMIFDSEESVESIKNYLDRPEVASALRDESGEIVRFSETTGQNQIYAAVRVDGFDGKSWVLRTGITTQRLNDMVFYARRDLIMGGIFAVFLVIALYQIARRRIATPIARLKKRAAKIASGDLSYSLEITRGSRLIREMSTTLERMLLNLKRQIKSLRLEKSKRDVIFASMGEGVIALDNNGVIIDLNPMAARILELPTLAVGLSLHGIVHCQKLQKFIEQVQNRDPISTVDLSLETKPVKYLRVRGTIMESVSGTLGTVLVLSDITRMHKLENFRSDFIADVSHEIRTPLMAITGAVEALQHNVDDEQEQAKPFMSMILRQSEHLNNLVKDILNISTLEYRGTSEDPGFTEINLVQVVKSAVELARPAAEEQKIKLTVDLPDELLYHGDSQLLEQATYNLIENAIRYSGGTEVTIALKIDDNMLLLEVSDNGCGITKEHLPRLFERFYRVDKARSRKLGGTGLGLAIVKHIIQHHGGKVAVSSIPAHGSTFTIRLKQT
ncbi:MAG: ATP-binding protein [Victivallaceae bacterium]|nr:ATP-binding protein [Victivallaceae bacterium]